MALTPTSLPDLMCTSTELRLRIYLLKHILQTATLYTVLESSMNYEEDAVAFSAFQWPTVLAVV